MAKPNNAKSLIMQPMFRARIVRDKTKHRRKKKHPKNVTMDADWPSQIGVPRMSRASQKSEETPQELFERIRPLYEAVDPDNLSASTKDLISTSELSGTEVKERGKRLFELLSTDVITGDECRALILHLAE